PDAARAAVDAVLDAPKMLGFARHAWPLTWWGLRIEADLATRDRDRRRPVSAQTSARSERLAAIARKLRVSTAAEQGYARLVEAERARLAGEAGTGSWREAVAAWREAGEPHG